MFRGPAKKRDEVKLTDWVGDLSALLWGFYVQLLPPRRCCGTVETDAQPKIDSHLCWLKPIRPRLGGSE